LHAEHAFGLDCDSSDLPQLAQIWKLLEAFLVLLKSSAKKKDAMSSKGALRGSGILIPLLTTAHFGKAKNNPEVFLC
jgi:hypothetical protein